jgi:hypothetical protein
MPQLEDNIVLILSSDPKNTAFGTGFIIARDQNYSYLLTCAHVLEQIKSKSSAESVLKIADFDASVEVVECGSGDGIDMALLKVQAVSDAPLFERFIFGSSDCEILISGYSNFEGKTQAQRNLKGSLGETIKLNNAQGIKVSAWDINIKQKDGFSKLAPGYSGSPVYNANGEVLGIVSHMRGSDAGHAVCISNLLRLCPNIVNIQPNFKRLTESSRLSQIRTKLLGRMTEIAKVYLKLGKRLNQIEKEGIDDEAEIILQMCESFLNKDIDSIAFSEFCQSLETTDRDLLQNQPNYKLLAQRLKDGEICLCLGTEIPKLFDASLKSVQELPERIATLTGFNNGNPHALAEMCEYAELNTTCTRHSVVSELKQLVMPPLEHQPKIALYELLMKLEQPFLIISTGFDTLLEQRLGKSNQRFVSIVTNVKAESESERYMLKYSDGKGEKCSDEQLSTLQLMEQGYSLIFHPRGYYDDKSKNDTLLLSERDYFFTPGELAKKRYPAYLHNKLKSRGLWFLGYQPDSWETRLIAKVLQYQRGSNNRDFPLVVQPNIDAFAQLFWREMQCLHYDNLSVTDFVAELAKLL